MKFKTILVAVIVFQCLAQLSCNSPLDHSLDTNSDSPRVMLRLAKELSKSDIGSIDALVTGDNINDTLKYKMSWDPINNKFSGSIQIPKKGASWTVTIVIRDKEKRKIGQGAGVLDNVATRLEVSVDCGSAKPKVVISNDTIVSIKDLIHLHAVANDSFNGKIAEAWWIVGNKRINTLDTMIAAPEVPESSYCCVFKAMDNDGNETFDTMMIRVQQAAPTCTLTAAQSWFLTGQPIRVKAKAHDTIGSIVRHEWSVGNKTWFQTYRSDTSFTIDLDTAWIYCRVVDDDNNSSLDSVFIWRANRSVGQMKFIGRGKYLMGDMLIAPPVHSVTITRDFLIDSTEITPSCLRAANYSCTYHIGHTKDDNFGAAFDITWINTVLFCNTRSKKDNYDSCYQYQKIIYSDSNSILSIDGLTCDFTKNGYRLPTEAEWEYACRAGTSYQYYWGNTMDLNYAWWTYDQAGSPRTVGLKLPNNWGLYDMIGNVSEWCWDWWAAYDTNIVNDPIGPLNGTRKIARGGCVLTKLSSGEGSSMKRYDFLPIENQSYVGFRCVRNAF